jgi:hypothetical protein
MVEWLAFWVVTLTTLVISMAVNTKSGLVPDAVPSRADGSIACCKEYLKLLFGSVKGYQSIDWSSPVSLQAGMYLVNHRFRQYNKFGGFSTHTYQFYYSETGSVLRVEEVKEVEQKLVPQSPGLQTKGQMIAA